RQVEGKRLLVEVSACTSAASRSHVRPLGSLSRGVVDTAPAARLRTVGPQAPESTRSGAYCQSRPRDRAPAPSFRSAGPPTRLGCRQPAIAGRFVRLVTQSARSREAPA